MQHKCLIHWKTGLPGKNKNISWSRRMRSAPFIVTSDQGKTQALGTAFEVAKNQQTVAVTVMITDEE